MSESNDALQALQASVATLKQTVDASAGREVGDTTLRLPTAGALRADVAPRAVRAPPFPAPSTASRTRRARPRRRPLARLYSLPPRPASM
ncbi:hypothetical protein [Burkholderia sp. A2]|uniref:hypothetical protein n=1 Tax=Burkholderia sp. A2 TaxID=236253 RepID=UPI0009FBA96D|nr:hypothetical protein [Burkholderia sp. A2]